MDKPKVHIIAFDVPYPPNYGGIADVFYKLKSLHEAGAEIIYHCFYYKGHNPPTKELEKYCSKLYYYERKQSIFKLLFSKLPYVVATRNDSILLLNILSDPAPVLMDGIQCTYWLLHNDVQDQKILYRANNIEHEYYEGLAHVEKNIFRKWYLKMEAKKLRNYEWQIRHADITLCVARQDIPHFEQYGKTIHLPPFFDDTHTLDFSQPQPEEKFVLFQANLSVTENENAATHIIEQISPLTEHKIIIAGRGPSASLKSLAGSSANVELIDTPDQETMSSLIRDAQIHLLLTFQQTGIKLKLLHALQSGRHIIINKYMDDDGIFAEMCDVVNESNKIADRIDELMNLEFTKEMKADRDQKFNAIYSNKIKAEKILKFLKS
ncbi:MAG: glycosyltransferase [Crocinitomicaceae bacterium]|nr:glycosyltransferase [Crocinitomicaceae bacterium]